MSCAIRWENSWELHWEIEFYETGGKTPIDDDKPPVYSDWCIFVDVSSSSEPPAGYEEFLDFVATDRGSESTRVRTEFPPLRDIPENTGHQDIAQLAKRWLQTCKDHHDCSCASEDGWYPKRLIHVGDDQHSPRLIILENERPEGSYAALSHCWGEDPNSSRNELDTGDGIERPNLWNICAIFTADDFSWARVDLPLSNRAWVFQERLLSPRTLHFGSDRISWECAGSHNLTEYLREGVSDVARRCISWFGSDYCAGIFRRTMPHGLLWEMSAIGQLGSSKVYRAPSWSWASLDCRVRFDILPDEGTVLADVVDVAVELVDPNNQFGQVKSASLILTGSLVASSDELVLKGANDEKFVAEGHTFGISADTEN
ncbi:hypothetical protein FAGAP_8211 [Fusarium agapanthi]|uniref:Heterokaryon incompatibility domain-containing protein n=1 Tax=Fusarium agapanthi TaxID=1803897 RepID=A0A9P5B4H2_9HYPO|nr:hypothetical protein FAGAP_8211 [Fusarium agapanthi]